MNGYPPNPNSGRGSQEGSVTPEQMRRAVEASGIPIHSSRNSGMRTGEENWQAIIDEYLEFLQRQMSNPELSPDQRLKLHLTVNREEEARQRNQLANLIRDDVLRERAGFGEEQFGRLVNDLYDELIGLSVLAGLWRDPEVTEILVDGWDRISYEKNGTLHRADHLRFRSPKHAATVARNLAEAVSDRALTRSNPLVTARIPNSRVAFAYGEVAASGLYIALRKHHVLMRVEDLLDRNAMT
ncbi:MAG: hypothetical protein ACF8TS_13860, partial [Maioricimonas sp. JB049]